MKMPAFQFYPTDWLKDLSVQSLSFEQKGVWIDLLCIMHLSEERGKLIANSLPIPCRILARMIGIDVRKLQNILHVLVKQKVAYIDANGVIYNKRMVKDEALMNIRREAGSKGGNPKLVKQEVNQKTTPSSSSSSSSSDIEREEHTFEIPKNAFTAGNEHLKTPLPESEINKTIEYIQIRVSKKLLPTDISKNWTAFKIQNFTGKKFYQSWQECFKHFRDWLKCELNNGFEKNKEVAPVAEIPTRPWEEIAKERENYMRS